MQPSLQTALPNDLIQCDVCQWHCELAPGATGRCRVRTNRNGRIVADAHGLISGATISPIEDQRLWHFFPDSQVLSIGSFGTPLDPPDPARLTTPYAVPAPNARSLTPERAVQFALQRLCRGMLWTFGDPAVNLEWVLDGVKIGRANSRWTAIATSGYFSADAFALLAPDLDGMRLDVYGFSDRSYEHLTGFHDWRSIFTRAAEARQQWNIHIEIAYQLVPGVNDSDAEIGALAKWMRGALGTLTPLHILGDRLDEATVARVVSMARSAGVQFVYGPATHQTTQCPRCSWVVIERSAGSTQISGAIDDICEECGTPLGLRTSIFRRNVRYNLTSVT